MRTIFLILYYWLATHLPGSYSPYGGRIFNRFRIFCVRRIFKKCGNISTVDRKAYFGSGAEIEIGDFSGIGSNCRLPNDIKIGRYVMMAPGVTVINANHNFSRTDVPMCFQGSEDKKPVTIEDDVWLGTNAIILPGVTVARGTIVGAGSVVTKNFPEYSIIGGNPARLIRSRIES
ncbi:MAG: acyltransferase [Duncaniella sp.]|nr:acyltransferase [Duncaniella sp.]